MATLLSLQDPEIPPTSKFPSSLVELPDLTFLIFSSAVLLVSVMASARRLPNVHHHHDAAYHTLYPGITSSHHHRHHHHRRIQQQVHPDNYHHQSYLHQLHHHTQVNITPYYTAYAGYLFYPTRRDVSSWSTTGYFYPGYHWELHIGPAQSTRSGIRNNQEAEQTLILNALGTAAAASRPPGTTSGRNWIREDDTLMFVNADVTDDPAPTTHDRGDHGVSEDTISKYLKIRQAFNDQDEICVICQDNLLHEDHDRVATLDCKHEFHFDCIKNWLTRKNSCPLCKAERIH